MAEYSINIYVHDNEQGEGIEPVSQTSQDPVKKNKKKDDTLSVSKVLKSSAVGHGLSIVNRVVTNDINKISVKTGATTYQQKLSFRYSQIRGLASSLASIAFAGSIAGIHGAVLSAAYSTASSLLSYAQQMQAINLDNSLESVGISQALIRAGANGNRDGR